jgi:uncharacterized membrane-anchored protein
MKYIWLPNSPKPLRFVLATILTVLVEMTLFSLPPAVYKERLTRGGTVGGLFMAAAIGLPFLIFYKFGLITDAAWTNRRTPKVDSAKRILIGVIAIMLLLLIGALVWHSIKQYEITGRW